MTKEDAIRKLKEGLERALERFRQDAAMFRTQRPSPALIENVAVECYGAKMSLKEIATIAAQPPNALMIQPWDKTNLQSIEKAILKTDLGVSPVVDGEIIRINLPPLTAERREGLVKALRKKTEETKIAFRVERDEARKKMTELLTAKQISEDEKFRAHEEIQKVFDDFTARLQEFALGREREITIT